MSEFKKAPDTIEMVPLLPLIIPYAEKANVAIDIGVCKATGSTRYILKGMEKNKSEDKIFIGIDHEDQREDWFDLKDWQFFVMGDSRSKDTFDKVRKIIGNNAVDLIFIDTIHEYDFLKEELELWSKLAYSGTTWLFHDTWMFGQYNHMTDAIKEFANKYSDIWEYVDITRESHGLGMLKPKNG